jgi:penicillin-binding protein 1C
VRNGRQRAARLAGRPPRRWRRRAGAVLGAAAAICAAAWLAACLAPFPDQVFAHYPASVVLTDRLGQPLRVWLGEGDIDCRPSYRPDRSHWIVQALVAAEDRRFWSHGGVDLRAVARALAQNAAAGRTVSGASTLSTQVIRLVEPRPRRWGAKAVEAFRALQLEQRYDKRTILAQYLNRAPFGGNIVGIEAASWRYFGKRPADLSLAEAALLAGVPQSPSRGRPDRHPGRARKRQAYVLARMRACGCITAAQEAEALAQPVVARPSPYPFDAPHFTEWVGAGASADAQGVVRTTLDPVWQQRAGEILRQHLRDGAVRGGAVVMLEVRTGAVRAMVGSPEYAAQPAGQVNGALAARSAGSTLKPFAYAMALDQGWLTPGSVLADVPARFRDYDPQNFDPLFRGRVTARDALVLSLNMPAIEVVRRVGQVPFYDTLKRLGLATLSGPAEQYGLGLVLGNGEVRLLDLANAYACLARGGVLAPVRVREGDERTATGRRVFSKEACWILAEMLSGDERAMDTTGHAADVRLPRMAWKTGTSAGLRDAWAVAYNPDVVIGVWVGRPDGAGSDQLIGRAAATPIAWELFRSLYPDNQSPWYERPAGVTARLTCPVSGRLPGPHCPPAVEDWAIARVTRCEPCEGHGGPGARAELPATGPRAAPPVAQAEGSLRIITPARDSTFRWMGGLDAGAQRIPLTATGPGPGEPLHWFVNDRPVGVSRAGEPLFWPLERGAHQIVCSSVRGPSDRIRIVVE